MDGSVREWGDTGATASIPYGKSRNLRPQTRPSPDPSDSAPTDPHLEDKLAQDDSHSMSTVTVCVTLLPNSHRPLKPVPSNVPPRLPSATVYLNFLGFASSVVVGTIRCIREDQWRRKEEEAAT
jgi:hypothetical protein